MRVQWIGQSATPHSSQIANLRLMNAYPEVVESRQGKSVVAVHGTPGLTRFMTLSGSGPVRALFTASNGRCFAVQGPAFFEITQEGTATAKGTLSTSTGAISMEDNGTYLVLVDGESAYTLEFASFSATLQAVTDPDFPLATRVAFVDQYFVFNKPGTQQFYWMDLAAITFDPLSFASAEGNPDRVQSLIAMRREIWLFGTTTTEVWVTTGDLDSPFTRVQGAMMRQGTIAPASPAIVGETLCWLSANEQGSGLVVQAQGYLPQRISTHPLEQALRRYSLLSDALGWGYQQEGHFFYVLTFPTAEATWVYDLTTGVWHERGFLDPATGRMTRHRANCFTFAFNRQLVGDFEFGHIYVLDPDAYSDDGSEMLFEVILPPFFDGEGLHRVRQDRLQVDCQVGVGLDGLAPIGRDPVMVLQLSNDGGQSWPIARTASLGKIGQTRARVQWHQLGSAFDRRVRLWISDPVRRTLIGVVTDIQALAS